MKNSKRNKHTAVVGFAWYRRKQWPRLLEVSEDRAKLEKTYDEWLEFNRGHYDIATRKGIRVHKIDVDVEELLSWCRKRNVPVNGEARSSFVTHKLAEKNKGRS